MKGTEKWSKKSEEIFHGEGKWNFPRYKWFAERLPPIKEGNEKPKVLEIGCNTGDAIKHISDLGWDCTAIDISDKMERPSNVNLIVLNVDTPHINWIKKVGVDTYDAIIMGEVLQHIIFDADLLSAIWLLLKPDGVFLMSTESRKLANHALRYYPKDSIKRLLNVFDFNIIETDEEGQDGYIWVHATKRFI